MYSADFEGILFVEGQPPDVSIIKRVDVALHGPFSQAHLKTLDDVKSQLARKVRSSKGNCLINFKYGQRSSFWSTLVGLDNVSWYGSGDVANMSQDQRAQLHVR